MMPHPQRPSTWFCLNVWREPPDHERTGTSRCPQGALCGRSENLSQI